jgi:hypothetical protein
VEDVPDRAVAVVDAVEYRLGERVLKNRWQPWGLTGATN